MSPNLTQHLTGQQRIKLQTTVNIVGNQINVNLYFKGVDDELHFMFD